MFQNHRRRQALYVMHPPGFRNLLGVLIGLRGLNVMIDGQDKDGLYSPTEVDAANVLFQTAELRIDYFRQTINTISTQIATLKRTNLGLM